MAKNDGGAAFPTVTEAFGGMSLRDYFAAAALQGLLMSDANEDNVPSKDFIITAYDLADAMLKEREKRYE